MGLPIQDAMMVRRVLVVTACLLRMTTSSDVPLVPFEALLGGRVVQFGAAVAREGLFQVSDVPGLGRLRRSSLELLAKCAIDADGLVHETLLSDGALRKTVAATTQQGKAHDLATDSVFGRDGIPSSCR